MIGRPLLFVAKILFPADKIVTQQSTTRNIEMGFLHSWKWMYEAFLKRLFFCPQLISRTFRSSIGLTEKENTCAEKNLPLPRAAKTQILKNTSWAHIICYLVAKLEKNPYWVIQRVMVAHGFLGKVFIQNGVCPIPIEKM